MNEFNRNSITGMPLKNINNSINILGKDLEFIIKERQRSNNPVFIRNKFISTSEVMSLLKEIKFQEKQKFDSQIKELKFDMEKIKADYKKLNKSLFNADNSTKNLQTKKPVVKLIFNNFYDREHLTNENNMKSFESNYNLFHGSDKRKDNKDSDVRIIMDKYYLSNQYKTFLKNEEDLFEYEKNNKIKRKKLNLNRKIRDYTRSKWVYIVFLFHMFVFFKTLKRVVTTRNKRTEIDLSKKKQFKEDLYVITRFSVKLFINVFNNIKLLNGYDLHRGFHNRVRGTTIETQNKILKQMIKIVNNQIVNLVLNFNDLNHIVMDVLKQYVKDRFYYVEEFLFQYEINRIDFNFWGIPRQMPIENSAMIIAFFVICKAYVFNFLLKPERFSNDAMRTHGFKNAAAFLGSIINRLIISVFEGITVKVCDYFSFLNFYSSRKILNNEVESFDGFLQGDVGFELSENQVNTNLFGIEETNTFFENEKVFCMDFVVKMRKYFISFTKRLRDY